MDVLILAMYLYIKDCGCDCKESHWGEVILNEGEKGVEKRGKVKDVKAEPIGRTTKPNGQDDGNPFPPKNYLGKFYLDSLVHDEKMLQYLVDLVGANRVALGSDYPFPLGENIPGSLIKEMSFNNDVKEQLLSGTALEWLGLLKKDFV